MSISDERKIQLDNFCKKFGFVFENYDTLNTALTHSSYDNENCYERLEFLGDSVLKIAISEYLYNKYPNDDEGMLTKIRAEIVSDKTISKFSRKIGLLHLINFGKSEEQHNFKENSMINACVFEAFLGAFFLETHDLKLIADFILNNFKNEIEEIEATVDFLNPKAMLQEYTQKKDRNLPHYILVDTSGKDHERIYKIAVYYNDEFLAQASANSKKEAEKKAAYEALIKLNIIEKEQI